MAVIKQACPKCGQRVSGDESFYGTSVECPICTSKIFFPDPNKPKEDEEKKKPAKDDDDVDKDGDADSSPPALDGDEKKNRDSKKSQVASEDDADEEDVLPLPTKRRPIETGYAEPPSATLSIISMVLGILNAVTFCIPAILLAPASIICGHIALIKGKFSPIQPAPGRSMAITGLILGYLGMAVMLVALGLAVTGIFNIFEWFRGHFGGGVHTGDGKGG